MSIRKFSTLTLSRRGYPRLKNQKEKKVQIKNKIGRARLMGAPSALGRGALILRIKKLSKKETTRTGCAALSSYEEGCSLD